MARLLNSSQAARYLGISKGTLHRLVSQGQGPVIKERSASGCYRIDVSDLEAYKTARFIASYTRGVKPVVRHGARS